MASFLGGLGQGLGAIGAGVGRGELLGAQQTERMRSAKAMQDYRTALLAAQQQKAAGSAHNQDIAHAVRLQAGIEKYLNDPEKQADLKNNPGLLTRLLTRHRDLNEVASGRASLTDLPQDSIVDSLASFGIGGGLGAGAGLGAGGATPPPAGGPGLGGGVTTAPSASPPPPPSGPPPMQPLAPINPILERARMQGVAPGVISPPRPVAGPPMPGGPPMFSPSPGTQIPMPPEPAAPAPPPPPAETAAPTAPPEQAPPQMTPAQELAAEYRKGPNPGETQKQFTARMRGQAQILGLDLKSALNEAQIPALQARAGRDTAEGRLAGQKSAAFPEVTEAGLARTRAQTGLAGAQQRQIEALTPERVNQIRSTVKKQSADVLIAAQNAQTAINRLNEDKRKNLVNEQHARDALASEDALRQKQIAHINFIINNGDALKMTDAQKLQARQAMEIINAVDKDAAGVAHPRYSPDVIKNATDQINGLYQQLHLKPIFGATAVAGQAAGQAGLGAVTGGGAAVTPAMRAAIGPHIKSGTVHQYYLNAPTPAVQQQIRAAYEAITHQPWPG